jgi:hypothetical protein
VLQQLVSSKANTTDWKVGLLKQGRNTSKGLVAISADTPANKIPRTVASLERIGNEFRRTSLRQLSGTPNLYPAQQGWVQVIKGESKPVNAGRKLARGALAGLVLGCGAGLIADRRSGRVFSLRRIRQQLPYPLWGRLPFGFSDGTAHSVAVDQLAAFLKADLSWQVLSIATPHPQLPALVETLRERCPGLDVVAGPVLLREGFNPGAAVKPVGCLLLVQSGFNSEAALEQAHGLLEELPGVAEVALVLSGCTPPPELVHNG